MPPDGWWRKGVNDRFAFGHPAAMRVYGGRVKHAKEFAAAHRLHSESLLRAVLQRAGIAVHKTELLAERVRAHGMLRGMPVVDKAGRVTVRSRRPSRLFQNALGAWEARECREGSDCC